MPAPLPLPPALDRAFAAVLFDMDGTLVSSVEAVERSWLRLADELGVEMFGFDEVHGVPARALIDRLLAGRPDQERAAALRRIVELEVADVDGTAVLPGARQALAAVIPGRGAIVTSCSAVLATARLEAAGLGDLPRITADDVTRGKPDAEPYLAGAALLGVDPRDCLVVEDAAPGLMSARAAGMTTLALATTHTAADLDADAVVGDLSAVRLVVGRAGVRVVPTGNHPPKEAHGAALAAGT